MLTLIHASNMPYSNVLNYYYSYDPCKRYNELTSFSLLNAKIEKEYLTSINVFEKNLYYLIDTNTPDIIIGHGVINIRSSSFESRNDFAEIAYGINPDFRQMGYGTNLLSLLIEKSKEFNLNRLYISCNESNLGSKKIIEKNGATFKCSFNDIDGKPSLQYQIKLKHRNKVKNKHKKRV